MSTIKLCYIVQEWRPIVIQRAGASADSPARAAHLQGSAAVRAAGGRLEWQCGAGPHHCRLPAGAAEIPCPPHARCLPCCAGCGGTSAPQSEVSGVALISQRQWCFVAVGRSVHLLQTSADVTTLRHMCCISGLCATWRCPLIRHGCFKALTAQPCSSPNDLVYTLENDCSTKEFKHLCQSPEVGVS